MGNYAKSLDKLRSSALGAATVRAFATLEVDALIRNPDYLAMQFLDTPFTGQDALPNFKRQLDQILPGAYHFQNARTLHIDACITRAINDGYQQIAMLGAGFDTRAYRLENTAQVQFIEFDLLSLQVEKNQKLARVICVLPANVAYLP
jgi:methyltransferase (TIGR00027 family)